jgi:UDPglucose 6-dehydrogenase
MRLCVVGLGKLGLGFAEALALEHEVAGFDIAPRASATLRIEPSLAAAAVGAEVVFVVLPTPHEPAYDGSSPASHLPARDFGYDHVADVIGQVDEIASPGAAIAVVSTLLPGTVRRALAPRATRSELLYTPAFMAMGRIREDFLDPEFRLLGSKSGDASAGEAVQKAWAAFGGSAPLHRVTWEEAEAIKVFYNVFISFKLAFVNTIQDTAQRVGHMDVDLVTGALAGARQRILAPLYLRAGMGDGGPCHPRDLIALRHLSAELDLGYDLFGAVAAAREAQARHLAEFLLAFDLPVLLTARSFKPGVPYTDGSSALLVAHYVAASGRAVRFLGEGDVPAEPHAVLLVHDVEHAELDLPPGSVVVDPWRRFQSTRHRVIHYGSTRR